MIDNYLENQFKDALLLLNKVNKFRLITNRKSNNETLEIKCSIIKYQFIVLKMLVIATIFRKKHILKHVDALPSDL